MILLLASMTPPSQSANRFTFIRMIAYAKWYKTALHFLMKELFLGQFALYVYEITYVVRSLICYSVSEDPHVGHRLTVEGSTMLLLPSVAELRSTSASAHRTAPRTTQSFLQH